MPSDSGKRKRKKDEPLPPHGIIPINMVYTRLTNIYGPEDMMDDPEVQEALEEINASDSEGE